MLVTIKTAFGEMTLELTKNHALELIQQAVAYAVEENLESAPQEAPQAIPAPVPAFPAKAEEAEGAQEPIATYTGFIYARCEACGKEKGFCAKIPISHHKCECGHHTQLKKMRPARVICECGGDFTYKTNIQDTQFTINCLACDAPVDMELNRTWTAFNPVR